MSGKNIKTHFISRKYQKKDTCNILIFFSEVIFLEVFLKQRLLQKEKGR